nr:integrase, catalytic core [Tanacetum cinerariifolium]
ENAIIIGRGRINKEKIAATTNDGEWIDIPSSVQNKFYHHFANTFTDPDWSRVPMEGTFPRCLRPDNSRDRKGKCLMRRLKRVRCDNGGEFTSNSMITFCEKNGILLETTCPHTPQQNGVVETKHIHLLETARALRFEANIPKRFWGECILTAAYIINRLPSKVIKNKTPYELVWNEEPIYEDLRIFSPVLGPKIKEDHAISHKETKPRSKRVQTQPAHVSEYVVNLPPSITNYQPGSNQANSTVHPISHFVSYDKFSHSHKAFLTTISSNHEPSCFEQATQDEKWRNAMQQEIKAFKKNRTWTLEELPEGKRPIDSKWVYKTKYKSNGEVERYKARFVAEGCTQREGVDYHETFSLVAKLVTVQTLLVQGTKLDKGEEEARVDATQYRRLVGRLLYLQATRPDVTNAVHVLSQFISDPQQSHLEAAKRVLRYLKGTPGRSRTRYLLLFSGSPISWKMKKQLVVSRSSAEAEYKAIASTVSEIVWVRWLLKD